MRSIGAAYTDPAHINAGSQYIAGASSRLRVGKSELRSSGTKSVSTAVHTGEASDAVIYGSAPGSRVEMKVGENSHVAARIHNEAPDGKAQMQVLLRGGQNSAEISGVSHHRRRELGSDNSALWWSSNLLAY